MKNQNGMSLISVMIALGVASLLALLLAQLNVIMVRNNTTAMANSDMLAYTNQLRGNIQYLANSTAALAGNSFTGTNIVLKDPLTGAVVAGPNFKQQQNDAWKIKNLRFDNVVSVPSQANLYRGTLVAVIELDTKRIIGSSIKTKTIGDVYCLANAGVIQSCYGSTDLTTMAQSNCLALGGAWDTAKAFGTQCAITVAYAAAPTPTLPVTPTTIKTVVPVPTVSSNTSTQTPVKTENLNDNNDGKNKDNNNQDGNNGKGNDDKDKKDDSPCDNEGHGK